MSRSLGLLLLLVTTIGPVWADDQGAARSVAERSTAEWNEAFHHGRLEEIVALYANDAILLGPNGSVARGVVEIRDFWRTLIGRGDYAMDVVSVRSENDGSVIATLRFSDVKRLASPDSGTMKYSYGGMVNSVLKRQEDGSWKAEAQRWSSDNHT